MAITANLLRWLQSIAPAGEHDELKDILESIQPLSDTEAAFLDGVTAGTAAASKALVNDASGQIDVLNVDTTMKYTGTSSPTKATFAAASAGANVCEVTITLTDEAGTTVGTAVPVVVWLSDSYDGGGITSTSASGTVQAKSGSVDLGVLTAKKAIHVLFTSGTYVLEITDSAKTGFYVAIMVPGSGIVQVSEALVSGDYG